MKKYFNFKYNSEKQLLEKLIKSTKKNNFFKRPKHLYGFFILTAGE